MSIPTINITALPEAEQEEAKHLSWLLGLLDSYREAFHYALLLEKYSTIERNRSPYKPQGDVYSGWHGIALREAALALFHFNYILTGIGHSIKACPTLDAKIDKQKMRAIKSLFSRRYFPQHVVLRDAVGHAGEIQHTRARLDANRYNGTLNIGGATLRGIAGGTIIADNTIFLVSRKKLASLELSDKNHERLKEIVEALYSLLRPLAE